MLKKDFITKVQQHFPAGAISKEWIDEILKAAADETVKALGTGEAMPVFGLGTLRLVERAARKGRNPQTGAALIIPARKALKFTPGAAGKRLAKNG